MNGKNCVIESTISGSSGEAAVYKAIIDGKPYALKLYKPNMPLSDIAKEVIDKIKNNPKDRIVKIYDFGSYNGQDFEVMEYAEGGTLEEYLKSSGAIHDTTKIKNIVKMIVEGLEQLHGEHKVIYQDLKPENIYFRDAKKTSLVLADFGISSIIKGYDKEVEVTASITDLYAAPELAHKGNRNEVMVTPAVDYFALGITMLELWLGEKPFKGVKATKRDYMIAEEQVDLPIDMPDDYATLIKGLIKPQRKDRWGNEQVRKWLKGEALAVEPKASKKASKVYDPLEFSDTEAATTPKELAALMEKYPDIGKTCLYDGIITEWFKKAGNLRLYNEIQNITSQYAKDKDAGLYTAILALDPERPFKSRGGKTCKTTEDIAEAIMAESAYYMDDLKRPTANLYLYLAATESSQGKEAADAFYKYFKEYSPKRALALVYLKLQGDGGITIGKKRYQSPEELKKENDSAQIDLIEKALKEKDSTLLVWLSDIYGDDLESTDAFDNLSTPEKQFLLGFFPYLSFAEQERQKLERIAEIRKRIAKFQNCISAYFFHTVGLKMDGTVIAVGSNDEGQCNTGSWRDVGAVAAGGNYTVGLKADGTVVVVGKYSIFNEQKKVEYFDFDFNEWRDFVAVTADYSYTVGLKADGTVVAVGDNKFGQCNTGSWRDIIAVAAGGFHTVGLKADGTVVTVGDNKFGQCNTGSWRDIVAIATSGSLTVGLKADGTVVTVGDNKFDQCNTGSWRDIVAIAASSSGLTVVGLKADGTVVAVGNNDYGQCNTGSWRDIVAIAPSRSRTVGLKSDGTVVAVGNNEYGQCNTGSWRNIGPVSEEKRIEWKRRAEQERIEQERRAEQKRLEQQRREEQERLEQQRREEQSKQWQEQGLCKYCGGKLGGLFSKKCKACGREN